MTETATSTSLEKIMSYASLGLVLLLWGYCIQAYSGLPETIVTHFNASGEPDGWGVVASIFVLPAIALGLYLLLTVLFSRYTKYINYPVPITEENKDIQLLIAKELMQVVNFLTILLITHIGWEIIRIAEGSKTSLTVWFDFLLIAAIFVAVWIYFRKAKANA